MREMQKLFDQCRDFAIAFGSTPVLLSIADMS
jgi:hypothetical protein